MPFTDLYEINYTLINPPDQDIFYTNADNSLRALRELQVHLDVSTLHRIDKVAIRLYNPATKDWIDLNLDRIARGWVDYVHTL